MPFLFFISYPYLLHLVLEPHPAFFVDKLSLLKDTDSALLPLRAAPEAFRARCLRTPAATRPVPARPDGRARPLADFFFYVLLLRGAKQA